MSEYKFSQVPSVNIPRSKFNRSHGHKTTFNAGQLIPIYVDEALPGDTFQVNAHMFARLATPIAPIMDNLWLDVFFFAVPNRLVWSNWQKFMGEQENPGDSTDFLVPIVSSGETGFAQGSMFDYFGMPVGIDHVDVSALFPRAYNLIYNEWFRDQNLIDSIPVPKDDGPDDPDVYEIRRRGKRHDYFTSCLPWPQKGPGVQLPLGDVAPVIVDPDGTGYPTFRANYGGTTPAANFVAPIAGGIADLVSGSQHADGAYHESLWGDPGLIADLSSATAGTINSLRQAFQIQRLLERDARGGTRYVEILRSHFGVVSPDARLQRPEYLGGGTVPVIINPVTQTSSTDATSPQGNLAAFGVSVAKNLGFSKSFVEHTIIIGIVCARADLSYQQGLPRMFSRRTRYDFYWPSLAHLGEQAVLNKEIYCQGSDEPEPENPIDEQVFGYQERWAEYRYAGSKITGKFRSTDPQPLDLWHLAQEFSALPVLNQSFIEENPPMARVKAVVSEPDFLFDSHFQVACTRPMPTYSVPGLIDHF